MDRRLFPCFVFIGCVFLLLSWAVPAHAQTDLVWDRCKSATDMYVVEFPGKPTVHRASIRIDPTLVLHSEQATYEESVAPAWKVEGKISYLIRIDQTFGSPLVSFGVKGETHAFLEAEVKALSEFYAAQGAKIVSSDVTGRDDFEGRALLVDLPSKAGVPMSVRATILVRGRTKVQQIVIAPKAVIERAPVAQFFHSLVLFRGEPIDNGEFKKDWVLFDLDGRGLFNVRVPPGAPPFIDKTPEIEVNRNMRTVRTAFYDPVRRERFFYRATCYDQGDSKITEEIFDLFLRKYHIEETDSSKILISRVVADDGHLHGKKIWSPVKPTPQNPGFEEKIIRAYYTNNYFGSSKIVVVEITGGKKTLDSLLAQNVLSTLSLRGEAPLLDAKAAKQETIKPRVAIDLK